MCSIKSNKLNAKLKKNWDKGADNQNPYIERTDNTMAKRKSTKG